MFKVLHSSLHRPVLSRSLNNSWRNALKTTWKKQFCLVSVGRKSKRNSLVTSGKQCEIIWQPNCTEAKEQNAFAEISLVLQMFLNMEGLKQVFTSLKNSYYPLLCETFRDRMYCIVAMKWISFRAAWVVLSFRYMTAAVLINQTLSCHSAVLARHQGLLCFSQRFSSLLPFWFSPQYLCRGGSQHLRGGSATGHHRRFRRFIRFPL